MNTRISIYAMGQATSLLLVISYTLCFAFDLVFPQYAMFETWQQLFPGFTGLNWQSFFVGFAEAYVYGWFFVLIWTPLYNYFVARNEVA